MQRLKLRTTLIFHSLIILRRQKKASFWNSAIARVPTLCFSGYEFYSVMWDSGRCRL
jgi:hypothetical protein